MKGPTDSSDSADTADYVAQLDAAGLVDAEALTQDERDVLNEKLSLEDVHTLINIKQNLGEFRLGPNAFFFPF